MRVNWHANAEHWMQLPQQELYGESHPHMQVRIILVSSHIHAMTDVQTQNAYRPSRAVGPVASPKPSSSGIWNSP